MKQTDASRHLHQTITDATTAAAHLDAAWTALKAAQPGLRSPRTDTGPRPPSGSDASWQVLDRALNNSTDPAVQQLRWIADQLQLISHTTHKLAVTLQAWATTAPPMPDTTPNCQWITRWLKRNPGHHHYDEARYRIPNPPGPPIHTGQWVKRWHDQHGQLPNDDILRQHITTGKVKVKAS